jgi:hypothetical protein
MYLNGVYMCVCLCFVCLLYFNSHGGDYGEYYFISVLFCTLPRPSIIQIIELENFHCALRNNFLYTSLSIGNCFE